MNTRDELYKRVDVLSLTDFEKAELIKAAREALRQQVKEAKFWRNFTECS